MVFTVETVSKSFKGLLKEQGLLEEFNFSIRNSKVKTVAIKNAGASTVYFETIKPFASSVESFDLLSGSERGFDFKEIEDLKLIADTENNSVKTETFLSR